MLLGPTMLTVDGHAVEVSSEHERAVLAILALNAGRPVRTSELIDGVWGNEPPDSAVRSLQSHLSRLRSKVGRDVVRTVGRDDYMLDVPADAVDVRRFEALVERGRQLASSGAAEVAVQVLDDALLLWRGGPLPDLGDGPVATAERVRIEELKAVAQEERTRAMIAAGDAGPAVPANAATLPSGTVSLLLTDIEGSTAVWDAHPDVMGAVVEHHTNLIGEAVVRHGGTLLKAKGEGDSTFSVFADPDSAVAAAIDARTALVNENWASGIELAVRLAVSTGPCEHRDGDYFGTTVNRAARVRGVAAGNDLLLSAATYNLVADSSLRDHVVADLGLHELKGIQRPERIWQVQFSDPATPSVSETVFDGATASDLSWAPSSLAGFVGRAEQRDALARSWGAAQDGGLQITLISGEPGVGKTSLAGDLAQRVIDGGGVVLFGRCPSDGLGSMTPIAEMVSSYARHANQASVRVQLARMGPLAGELLRIAPVLADVVPELEAPLSFDPEEDRRRLMSAVVAFIGSVAIDAPVLVVVDDIHWGDTATMAVIAYLMTSADEEVPVFLLGTYRDTDVVRGHPFTELRESIRRMVGSQRVVLNGLDQVEVRKFLEVASEQELDAGTAALAELLWRETAGNPLFVGEVLAHLTSSGMIVRRDGRWVASAPVDELPVPQGLAETIGHRLDQLSDDANGVLRSAAVIGSRFDADLLRAVAVTHVSVLDAIDEAISAGLITEGSSFGVFEFAHAVVRSTLLAELTMTRRIGMHWQIGTLLLDRGDRIIESAFHLLEGVLAGDAEIAATAGLAAAGECSTAADLRGASDWADRSLHLIESTNDVLDLRADLLNERANAMFANWGRHGIDARLAAIDAAVATGDPERIGAAAALVRTVPIGVESPELTAALARSLDALPDEARWARVRVLAAEAHVGGTSGSAELSRVIWCATKALDLADPNDVDQLIVAVQPFSQFGAAVPALGIHQERCLALLDQISPSSLSHFQWNQWIVTRCALLLLTGRFAESVVLQNEIEQHNEHHLTDFRVLICMYRSSNALVRGELRNLESVVDAVVAELLDIDDSAANLAATLVAYTLGTAARHIDLGVSLEPIIAERRQSQPLVAWASFHSTILAAQGRKQEAIEAIEAAALDDFASLPANSYNHGLRNIAMASVLTGYFDHLPIVREKLSVHPTGLIGNALGFYGSIGQTLGWISMALGESERALEELTLAVEQFESVGMRAFHAWAVQDLAELHHSMGEVDIARQMATAARAEADECGATMTVYRADLLLADGRAAG